MVTAAVIGSASPPLFLLLVCGIFKAEGSPWLCEWDCALALAVLKDLALCVWRQLCRSLRERLPTSSICGDGNSIRSIKV